MVLRLRLRVRLRLPLRPSGSVPGLMMALLSIVQAAVLASASCRGAVPIPGLSWESHPGHRRAALRASPDVPVRTGFTLLSPATTRITFTNRLDEERSLTNQILLNGSGVAAGDVDGDGLADLYFCGLDSANTLYRNLGGWRFEDITAGSGTACADQASTGAALVDVDGDGDLDLLVNGLARGTHLFLNDGRAGFTETTDAAGLRSGSGAASLAIADINADGLPDLYAVHYRNETMRDEPGIAFTLGVTNGARRLLSVDGRPADSPDLRGRFTFAGGHSVLENGEADVLYRNLGGGRFARVPWDGSVFRDERGQPVPEPFDWGLSAMFHDLNGDGFPDLYVCNDFQSPDRLWINDGHGHLQAAPSGVLKQTSLFSMGIDVADIDRDGHPDIFVADMLSREQARRQVQVMNAAASMQSRLPGHDGRPQFSRNTLFHNRGDGTFAELARLAGVDASDWSWCPAFLDVDLDGFEDLLITTGHWRDAQDADAARELDALMEQRRPSSHREQLRARRRFPKLETPNFAFRNRGDLTFQETGASWGFDSRRISQGLALADLDLDGDPDVVVNCLNDGPLILRNDTDRPRVAVQLRGAGANSRGIGARIEVQAPGLPVQAQEITAGGRYLSSDEPARTFAAGHVTNRLMLTVTWPGGRRSTLTNAPANHLYRIEEHAASPAPPGTPPASAPPDGPFFEDRSQVLGHQHVDVPYDDFARQPLLPHTLAHPGPAVAWFDFNGDGWEDLLVGAGRGGRIAVFRNDGQGGFIPQRAQVLQQPSDRDLTGLLCWRPAPNQLALLVGLDSYEPTDGTRSPGLRQVSLTTGSIQENTLPGAGSSGPLAVADIDGDGDLDLFVGGRVNPGRYPEPAGSTHLLNHQGRLVAGATNDPVLARLGLVQGATFTDLTGDHRPELAVATDWGPIRILRYEAGTFADWDPPVRWAGNSNPNPNPNPSPNADRLSTLTGCWNSIAAGDFDGDGRMDLIAGNRGRNTAHQSYLPPPLRLAFAEIDGAGTLGLIEARHDPVAGRYVPFRDRAALEGTFPSLTAAFPTFATFARAGLEDILRAGLPPIREVSAAVLDSIVLLNRGDFLEARVLPLQAQIAPVFGIGVADFDGDGHVDAVLSQNLGGTGPGESPHDAGIGVWLRGNGGGGFTPVPIARSGLRIDGEGRGLAVCDFDHDARPDLVAGQNRGVTRLFRNITGPPGLRIVLKGGPSNPQAVGAIVRLEFNSARLGPAHEIHLGGGYWSQDSTTLVPPTPEQPVAIVVRWPDGHRQRMVIPPTELEIHLSQPSVSP